MKINGTYKLLHRKTNHNRNRQPTEWEERLANNLTGKGFVSKTHKQLLKLRIKTTNSPIKRMGRDLYRHFPKKTYKQGRGTGKAAQHH